MAPPSGKVCDQKILKLDVAIAAKEACRTSACLKWLTFYVSTESLATFPPGFTDDALKLAKDALSDIKSRSHSLSILPAAGAQLVTPQALSELTQVGGDTWGTNSSVRGHVLNNFNGLCQ